MANNNLKRSFVLLALLGLSVGLCIAQEQPEFNEQEMMPPPEFKEGSNMRRMGPPPGFDENASGTFRMRRPHRRRGEIGSGTMPMFPPEFDENASGTMRMRRPHRRRGEIGSGTMPMFPPEFYENASGTMRMRRPPMGRPPMGGRPPERD